MKRKSTVNEWQGHRWIRAQQSTAPAEQRIKMVELRNKRLPNAVESFVPPSGLYSDPASSQQSFRSLIITYQESDADIS